MKNLPLHWKIIIGMFLGIFFGLGLSFFPSGKIFISNFIKPFTALIESIGSMGSTLLLDITKQHPVGIEINANHVGGIKTGNVIAKGKILHAGKRTHLWQVDITEEGTEKLICTGRLTVMIVDISNK